MKARSINLAGNIIEVTLDPGESLGAYSSPETMTQPVTFTVLKDVAGLETTEFNQLVSEGKLTVDPYVAPPKPHASQCTPAQGQMALYQAGHYDAFLQAVTNSNDVPLKIYAQSALKWEISNPHIQSMKSVLGLSDSDVQSLFDLAVTL
jgi:hypothetical protein